MDSKFGGTAAQSTCHIQDMSFAVTSADVHVRKNRPRAQTQFEKSIGAIKTYTPFTMLRTFISQT
jgi:hypothetical protein